MILGFTGTRAGLSGRQLRELRSWLSFFYGTATELHHGGCKGADAQAHGLCSGHLRIVVHPGKAITGDTSEQAENLFMMDGDRRLPVAHYYERNRAIVRGASLLIACPKSRDRVGGTWRTIADAETMSVPTLIIWP